MNYKYHSVENCFLKKKQTGQLLYCKETALKVKTEENKNENKNLKESTSFI